MATETKKRTTTRKKKAETIPEATEPVEVKEETYTRSQLDEIVAAAVAKALAEQASNEKVIRVEAQMVKMLFQCECSPVNVINFGPNGKFGAITGRTGRISVSKEAFLGEFRDELVQSLLASRELIVLDGLTDEERELYGVEYRKGEFMDEKVFSHMVEMGDALLDIYPDLNDTYKAMVAKRFADEYEKNPKKISRELVKKLNEMSKKGTESLPKGDARKKGAFYNVIDAMNKADAE